MSSIARDATLSVLIGLAVGAAACREPEPDARRGDESDVTADAAMRARRPSTVHVLARRAERCELYSMEGDTRSQATPTPCPPDLYDGERIRLAGDACLREGLPERARPVVCPHPLVDLELQDRAKR